MGEFGCCFNCSRADATNASESVSEDCLADCAGAFEPIRGRHKSMRCPKYRNVFEFEKIISNGRLRFTSLSGLLTPVLCDPGYPLNPKHKPSWIKKRRCRLPRFIDGSDKIGYQFGWYQPTDGRLAFGLDNQR